MHSCRFVTTNKVVQVHIDSQQHDEIDSMCLRIQNGLSLHTGLPADHHLILNAEDYSRATDNNAELESDLLRLNDNMRSLIVDDSSLTDVKGKEIQQVKKHDFEWQVTLRISGGKGEFGRALKKKGRKFRQDQMRAQNQNHNRGIRNRGQTVATENQIHDQPRFNQARPHRQVTTEAKQTPEQNVVDVTSSINMIERERLRRLLSTAMTASIKAGVNIAVEKIARK